MKHPGPRILSVFLLSFLAPVWITSTGGCRSSNESTSVPAQQSARPEQPAEPEPNASCGGLQGLACMSGEYCHYAPDQMCGAADQLGACRTIPEFCTEQFDPVCGCDDHTYSNSCKANSAGISVAATGPCAER